MANQTYVRNNQSMAALCVGAAFTSPRYGGERVLAILDFAGASTAVKAIRATALRAGPLRIGDSYYYTYRPDNERGYMHKHVTALPSFLHCLFLPEPSMESEYEVISSLTSDSPEEGLTEVLRLYTPFPVIKGWGEPLLTEGRKDGNIVQLNTIGSIDWAYIVYKNWGDTIDRCLKEGAIRVEEV